MRKFVYAALGALLLALFFFSVVSGQEDDGAIQLPYREGDYVLTADCHPDRGWISSCPIDLAGGKGTPLFSPISGNVSFTPNDGFGNPMWVIQNSQWKVLFLHGNFDVREGYVMRGQKIGTEGNNGYVLCWDNKPPNGRDCGYHTHIEIISLATGESVSARKVPAAKKVNAAEVPSVPVPEVETKVTVEELKTVGYGEQFKPSNPPVLIQATQVITQVPVPTQVAPQMPWWDQIPQAYRLPLLIGLVALVLGLVYGIYSKPPQL
jgi:hypothetical protein